MKIYLDTCSIQRPLDNKTQMRIILEADAILGILSFCEGGEVELVSSDFLRFEIERTPNITRQEYAWEVLAQASLHIRLSPKVEQRARDQTVGCFAPGSRRSSRSGLSMYLR